MLKLSKTKLTKKKSTDLKQLPQRKKLRLKKPLGLQRKKKMKQMRRIGKHLDNRSKLGKLRRLRN